MKYTNASACCFASNVVNVVLYGTVPVLYCTNRPYDNFRRNSTSTIEFSTRTLKMAPLFRICTGRSLLYVRFYWITSYGPLKSRNPIICTVWFYHFSSNKIVVLYRTKKCSYKSSLYRYSKVRYGTGTLSNLDFVPATIPPSFVQGLYMPKRTDSCLRN